MNKEQFWTTVITATIVGVLASIITYNLTSKTLLGPNSINANECTADGICEVNELQALNGPVRMTNPSWYIWSDGYIGATGKIEGSELKAKSGPIIMEDSSWYIWSNGHMGATGKIEGSELKAKNGPIIMEDSSWYIWSNGYIGADNLKGAKNAYVCVGPDGKIFRSTKACS